MGIYMCNNLAGDVNNEVLYEIDGEHVANGVYVRRMTGVITIPGGLGRTPNGFYWLYVGANQDGSSPQLYAQAPSTPPARDVTRVIGAWGTKPGSYHLAAQVQTNRVVQFEPDYTYDVDLDVAGGSYLPNWTIRNAANVGAFPAGLCSAVYVRAEARKMDNLQYVDDVNSATHLGLGFAQVNLGGFNVEPNVVGQPRDMHFRTQCKALTRYDQPEASLDMLRVIIEPRGIWYAVKSGEFSNITVLASGYELMPT